MAKAGGKKQKTKRGAAKRFRITGNGRIKRAKAYRSHILTKKTTKRKRKLRQRQVVDGPMQAILDGIPRA